MPHPTISVIIPVFNGQATLAGCLAALRQQTQPPDEIIVVDDGSTDGSGDLAARFGATVLRQPQAGPAAARNRGAQAATGALLLFTDADCLPAPTWVACMAAPFVNPAVAGVKGVYRSHQPEWVARFVQQEYQERYDRMLGQPAIDFVDTYAAGYRREIFLQTGGFDTSFPTASVEDQEFSFRLAAQGYRLVYAPGAIVYHRHNRTVAQYARRKWWIGYWKARVMRRYPAKLAHDSHTPPLLKVQLGLAGLAGLAGSGAMLRRGRSLAKVSAGLWLALLLSGLPLYLKILQRDPPVTLIAPVMILIRALVLGGGFFAGSLRFFVEAHANIKR